MFGLKTDFDVLLDTDTFDEPVVCLANDVFLLQINLVTLSIELHCNDGAEQVPLRTKNLVSCCEKELKKFSLNQFEKSFFKLVSDLSRGRSKSAIEIS